MCPCSVGWLYLHKIRNSPEVRDLGSECGSTYCLNLRVSIQGRFEYSDLGAQ